MTADQSADEEMVEILSMKANLRASREMLGLTQSQLAEDLGVTTITVKRWEDPGNALVPSAQCEELINAMLAVHENTVERAVDVAMDLIPDPESQAIQLTYYRDQEQFDAYGRDKGWYGKANANARAVAEILTSLGYTVGFAYPDDPENIYHNPDAHNAKRYR